MKLISRSAFILISLAASLSGCGINLTDDRVAPEPTVPEPKPSVKPVADTRPMGCEAIGEDKIPHFFPYPGKVGSSSFESAKKTFKAELVSVDGKITLVTSGRKAVSESYEKQPLPFEFNYGEVIDFAYAYSVVIPTNGPAEIVDPWKINCARGIVPATPTPSKNVFGENAAKTQLIMKGTQYETIEGTTSSESEKEHWTR